MAIDLAPGQAVGVQPAPATRRERWAWYLYDFGNSAYAAVVLLAVYSAYFKQEVVGGAEGSRLWGLSIGIAMLVVAVISPVLGALADFSAAKKRMLFIFTALACVSTGLLFFVGRGDIFTGMLFFILAEIGYRGGQVFYNALLPEIADAEDMGRVSGNGWALGSFGGIICLGIVLALILTFKGDFVIHLAFVITAVFYGLSTLPIFLVLRERRQPTPLPARETYLSVSFRMLWRAFQDARQHKDFIKFLVAFLVFNNGIIMVLDFAAIIGAVLYGLNQQQLIIFMMIVQVTSVIGAYLFGLLTGRVGGQRSLSLAIVLMILTITGLFFIDSLEGFFVIGALAGFSLTGVQSVSRTVVGQVCPVEKAGEYYGLFSLAGQISAFTGPAIFGVLATALALRVYQPAGFDAHAAEATGLQMALFAAIAALAVGLVLLWSIRSWKRQAV